MGLFKSEDEKQKAKDEKTQKLLDKYELNNLSKEYANAVQQINTELAGSGLVEFGSLLSKDMNASLRVQTQFLNALVQQNWIIIRQLNEINQKLEK